MQHLLLLDALHFLPGCRFGCSRCNFVRSVMCGWKRLICDKTPVVGIIGIVIRWASLVTAGSAKKSPQFLRFFLPMVPFHCHRGLRSRRTKHWVTTQPLKREWFFEQRNGNARLRASLTERLCETAPMWERAVAPVAEWVAQALWNSGRKPAPAGPTLPTRLTQGRRSEGREKEFILKMTSASPPPKICPGCGATTHEGRQCPTCGRKVSAERLIDLAKQGRVVAQSEGSQGKRSASQTGHEAAKRAWRSMPIRVAWPDEKTYMSEIQPRLSSVTISALSSALGVCELYAADIRAGRRRPHPRHWLALAKLVSVASDE